MAEGADRSTKEIAETLRISVKTIQVYYARINEKLGYENMTELLREAVRWRESEGGEK